MFSCHLLSYVIWLLNLSSEFSSGMGFWPGRQCLRLNMGSLTKEACHKPYMHIKGGIGSENYSKKNKSYQIYDTVGYRTPDMRRRCGRRKNLLSHPILNGDTGRENFHFLGIGHLSARQPLWRVHVTGSWKTLGLAS